MKPGIIICARIDSRRLPNKALIPIQGIPIIEHLIRRIKPSKLNIVIATPEKDAHKFLFLANSYKVFFFSGHEHSPLHRMAEVAWKFNVDPIIRITHDKIFIDPEDIEKFLDIHGESKLDYVYSSHAIDGTGFEVISRETLLLAANKFKEKKVEHISYAIKAVTNRIADIPDKNENPKIRLLIDYPEDLAVVAELIDKLGVNCTKKQVVEHLKTAPRLKNLLPDVTIYTCFHFPFNGNSLISSWLGTAINSVLTQQGISFEYIIIDDGSAPNGAASTLKILLIKQNKGIIYRRCNENRGIASASNMALSMAKGKYIIRLDADDNFVGETVVSEMFKTIRASNVDALYPDFYSGSINKIGKGHVDHHIGGTLFRTSAINHVKFTEGLRGYEGYDFFERARHQIKIGYYESPAFFYRQHDESLSKKDPTERAIIKKEIDTRLCENPIR